MRKTAWKGEGELVNIIAANYGGYPRIGGLAEQPGPGTAVPAVERGGIRERRVELSQNEEVRAALEEQAEAGLDVVSDGQIRWKDPVSHFMGKFSGVKIAGLLRYYDTDAYYSQPVVTGALESKGSLVAEEIKLARAISTRPVMARITGPLTLSRLSVVQGGPYGNADALCDALVPHLADEIERLAKAGAEGIVVEEPAILREPGAMPVLENALEVMAARRQAVRLWLFPSFGDAGLLYEKLQRLPVDGLILELTRTSTAAAAVASSGSGLCLGLGVADARKVTMESSVGTARLVTGLLRRVHAGQVMLVPSNGLEFLPRDVARRKLALLARARDLMTGGIKTAKRRIPVKRRKSRRRRGRCGGGR
jgi:5-methyltetrahydropteroyltriglutamate--homocysteine methyltransferase